MGTRSWFAASFVVALVWPALGAGAGLEEIQELRRHLRYDQAELRLGMLLPDFEGEERAQALLLLSQLDTDPREARRHLTDAARFAIQPATRMRIEIELATHDYARGSYRAVQSRLRPLESDPQAALWLGLAAAALGETATLPDVLAPAARSDLARALTGWAALDTGHPDTALARLAPVAAERKSAVLPSVLLWKVRAEATLGQRDAALATGAELRERFPDAPESKLVQSTLDELQGWATPQVVTPPPSDRFGLQVGAFEDRGNALRFRAGLPPALDPVTIQPVAGDRGALYRVVVGSFESREAAEAWARAQLQPLGYSWQAVRIEEARAR